MQLKSTNFISFVVTYILFIIFIAILVVRYLARRYARTEPFWASPLWWGGFFVWNVGCFTSLYVGVATWWWITDENLAEEYKMNNVYAEEDRLSLWLVYTKTLSESIYPIHVVYLQRAIGARIGLSLLYACLMMSVQGTFLALIRMGWGKLRPVAKTLWWILVVVLAVTFGVVLGLGFSIIGKQSSTDVMILQRDWETVEIFKAVTSFVTLLGLVQISTLSLLIITAATSAFNLYPYLPEHLGFRKVAILFLPAIFSIIINIVFLSKGLILFGQVRLDRELLKLMELFFLAYIACLPSIAIARAHFHQRLGNMCL